MTLSDPPPISAPHATDTAQNDPSGVPFSQLDPALLYTQRTSIKWDRFSPEILPLFVAEMDFAVAPEIRSALIERVEASDIGYVNDAAPLARAFADFALDRWGWQIRLPHVHLTTDVATCVVEALRLLRPEPGRLAISTPVYPGFFEMFQEVPHEIVELPLREGGAEGTPGGLDLEAIERAFSGADGSGIDGSGIDAYVLCNPHNPHGIAFTEAELRTLARLAAAHDVVVISDEIHAPLTHHGVEFVPFAPIAAAEGALAVTATSASKGWNLAGAKCAMLIAADDRANDELKNLPPEVLTRTSILGVHAGIAAFTHGREWLDRTVAQVEANDALLASLIDEHLPGVRYTRPRAGYLAWLDVREAGLGDRAHHRILREAKVALGNGTHFGEGGEGHVRLNLACAPDTIREAVRRIASILPAA